MNEFSGFVCLARVLARAMGDRTITISSEEQNVASETLKRMAEHRNGWTEEQKELYKMLVDFVNEATKEY
jgi:hypothetical protein